MSTFTIYRRDTGIFTGRWVAAESVEEIHLLDSEAAIEGRFDTVCQRVDVATGQVVDWQPPTPPGDEWQTWAWDAESRRHIATPTLAALQRSRIALVDAALDARDLQLARPVGEIAQALALGAELPQAAVDRVQALNAAKAELRTVRAAIEAAADQAALDAITWSP